MVYACTMDLVVTQTKHDQKSREDFESITTRITRQHQDTHTRIEVTMTGPKTSKKGFSLASPGSNQPRKPAERSLSITRRLFCSVIVTKEKECEWMAVKHHLLAENQRHLIVQRGSRFCIGRKSEPSKTNAPCRTPANCVKNFSEQATR